MRVKKILLTIINIMLKVYVILSIMVIGGAAFSVPYIKNMYKDVQKRQQEDNEDIILGQFILHLMDVSNAKLTLFQKQLIAQAIVRVTKNIFSDLEERKAFAVLVAIESKFNRLAKSSAGAVGLSQIMPKYANEFAEKCSIVGVPLDDLIDVETNLIIGACQFKELLRSLRGNTAAALVAYNAGKNSASLQEIQELRNITNLETVNYISRFAYVRDEASSRTAQTLTIISK